jgi:hypothetical protein
VASAQRSASFSANVTIATTERVYAIPIDALDWNCPQHIVPRFTEEEIPDVLAPIEKQVEDMEREIENLNEKVARLSKRAAER